MKIDKKFVLVLLILSFVMIMFANLKEGFHEDEIFSYGSSNNNIDMLLRRDTILNPYQPGWKTKEDALNYVAIQKEDILNYGKVYYFQSADVHPPLFYFLVHFTSTLFFGVFSKYIIFSINLLFFILSCIVIRKILILLDRSSLIIPVTLLYGLSMGAISIVLFFRMYQLLIFFVLLSLYIHLKIIKNEFKIDKKMRNALIISTILGFLTQYYFCIFIFFEFLIMLVAMFRLKKVEELLKYLKFIIISAVISIAIFPASINHIFFSYRGIGAENSRDFIDGLVMYFKELNYAFSLNIFFSISFVILLFIIYFRKMSIKKDIEMSILFIPIVLYFLVVLKVAPNMSPNTIIRYIAIVIPLISIVGLIFIFDLLKDKFNIKTIVISFTAIIIISQGYGIYKSNPRYMYKGYNQVLSVAKENKDIRYIYVIDNDFTYIQALPEFLIYNNYMIINVSSDDFSILRNDSSLKGEEQIIVHVKKWINYEEVMAKILANTNYTNYEVILDSDMNESIIYRVF